MQRASIALMGGRRCMADLLLSRSGSCKGGWLVVHGGDHRSRSIRLAVQCGHCGGGVGLAACLACCWSGAVNLLVFLSRGAGIERRGMRWSDVGPGCTADIATALAEPDRPVHCYWAHSCGKASLGCAEHW